MWFAVFSLNFGMRTLLAMTTFWNNFRNSSSPLWGCTWKHAVFREKKNTLCDDIDVRRRDSGSALVLHTVARKFQHLHYHVLHDPSQEDRRYVPHFLSGHKTSFFNISVGKWTHTSPVNFFIALFVLVTGHASPNVMQAIFLQSEDMSRVCTCAFVLGDAGGNLVGFLATIWSTLRAVVLSHWV